MKCRRRMKPKDQPSLAYRPKPIDTSDVTLTKGSTQLAELLAKNAHDDWAQKRFAEGWCYGPERKAALKEHPCLVPYEQLPESEKECHRQTALKVIKVLLAMGCNIEFPAAPSTGSADPSLGQDRQLADVLQTLESPAPLDLASLLGLWQARNKDRWSDSPEVYRRLANRIVKLGEPLLAYDVIAEGIKFFPGDVRLCQLLALALARSGATRQANAMLMQLCREGHRDEETLGILARTHKDLATQATDPLEREQQLGLAYEFYAEAYRLAGSYWTGINAATLALMLGQRHAALALAGEVRERCLEELKGMEKGSYDSYWPLATLGEAALLSNEWSEARDWYAQAAEVGSGRFAELSSTRRNARLLVDHLGGDRRRIEQCFRIPRVCVFAGHMIDQPHRARPRFPPQLESAVHDAIRERLKKLDARLGYASAACGSDILFLEAILELNGEAHIVLPYHREQFVRDSVEMIVPNADWSARYEQVLRQAAEVVTASEQRLEEGSISYEYANLFLLGLAKARAEQLETELVPLAVWDGKPGDGPGGTGSIVVRWRELGQSVDLIDAAEILYRECPQLATISSDAAMRFPPRTPELSPTLPAEIRAILFADAVGFSKLTEQEIPRFVKHFLGMIADSLATSRHAPLVQNTWGDGLYCVFSNVGDAGQFALDLCDRVGGTDWAEKGLPENLSLRIALHAAPVYSCVDPVTQQPNYLGVHVSRAARIEPITPPGQIYASQAFAALASAQRVSEFTCDYVGQTSLAKGYGTYPTYHLRRLEP